MAVLGLTLAAHAGAANVAGEWKAEFDTQIGVQKYTYTLQQDGDKVTGKANSDIAGEKREVELKEGKLDGDTITFVEVFDFQGNEVRIAYKGKIAGDEIKFTRNVGDFATEEFAAKRAAAASAAPAESTARPPARSGAPRFGPPVALGPEDKAAFPPAPAGFDARRDGIERGKIETVEYDSKTVGIKRKMTVYTPPGYSKDKKYPVLYLLHGIGDDETGLDRAQARPTTILDNLYADKKAVPMIVVMPNGRASAEPAPANPFAGNPFEAYAAFEKGSARGRDPVHRVALLGAGRPRAPGAGGTVDGRRPVAELRPAEPGHLRLGRRVLLGPQHPAGPLADLGPGGRKREAPVAMGLLRRQGRPDEHQQAVPRGPGAEGRPAPLARRFRRAHLARLEERPVPPGTVAVQG